MGASLANPFILERAEVELITTGENHHVPSGSGQEQLYKILASLATLQPTEPPDDGAHVEQAPRRRGWRFLRRSPREAVSEDMRNPAGEPRKSNGGTALRLVDQVTALLDERRFKTDITS